MGFVASRGALIVRGVAALGVARRLGSVCLIRRRRSVWRWGIWGLVMMFRAVGNRGPICVRAMGVVKTFQSEVVIFANGREWDELKWTCELADCMNILA